MPISGIGGVSSASLAGLSQTSATSGASAANPTSASGFGSSLSSIVDGVQSTQSDAKTLALKAVTGDLTDIHQATIAATRAQVTLELVSAVRNKGVDAFNEIMRMQA